MSKCLYREITMLPSGDGSEPWADANDLLDEIRRYVGEIYELGIDELPPGLENIRRPIHCESARIFGWLGAGPHYFAIVDAS